MRKLNLIHLSLFLQLRNCTPINKTPKLTLQFCGSYSELLTSATLGWKISDVDLKNPLTHNNDYKDLQNYCHVLI